MTKDFTSRNYKIIDKLVILKKGKKNKEFWSFMEKSLLKLMKDS